MYTRKELKDFMKEEGTPRNKYVDKEKLDENETDESEKETEDKLHLRRINICKSNIIRFSPKAL